MILPLDMFKTDEHISEIYEIKSFAFQKVELGIRSDINPTVPDLAYNV